MEQRVRGTLGLWAEPFVPLRVPKLFNLRTEPFERADTTSNTYYDWFIDHIPQVLVAQAIVVPFVETFKEFSTAPEGGQLHHRSGIGEDEATKPFPSPAYRTLNG